MLLLEYVVVYLRARVLMQVVLPLFVIALLQLLLLVMWDVRNRLPFVQSIKRPVLFSCFLMPVLLPM